MVANHWEYSQAQQDNGKKKPSDCRGKSMTMQGNHSPIELEGLMHYRHIGQFGQLR